jgi:hypothetical protein
MSNHCFKWIITQILNYYSPCREAGSVSDTSRKNMQPKSESPRHNPIHMPCWARMPAAILCCCFEYPRFTEPRPVYKIPPWNRVVSQMNRIYTLLTYFFENSFNIIFYKPCSWIIISVSLMKRFRLHEGWLWTVDWEGFGLLTV